MSPSTRTPTTASEDRIGDLFGATANAVRDAPQVVALFAVVAPIAAALPPVDEVLLVAAQLLGVLVVLENSNVRADRSHAAGVRMLFALLACLLGALVVLFGLLFFVVPGVYLWVRLYLVIPAALDGDGPVEALRTSWRLTMGWRVLTVAVVALGIVLAAVTAGIACLVMTGHELDLRATRVPATGTLLSKTVTAAIGGQLTAAASTAIYLRFRE